MWTDEKQRWEESEKRRAEERRSKKRKSQKKEGPGVRKGREAAKHCVFPMICGSGGSKSRLAKAAGAEPAGQMRDEKLHAVVARSTFPSQNVQNTPTSDHFLKLRCRKSARRCGAKHMSKSKCTKHTRFGPLLEVEMSKKCTAFWREAHFEVKMYKTHQVPLLEVEMSKSARRCGAKHISKSKCTKHTNVRPLLEVEMSKRCTRLWGEAHFEVKSVKNWRVRSTFGRSDVVSRGRRKGLCTVAKVSKTWGFCGISKNDGKRGTFEDDMQRCISRGRRSTRDMFIRAVRMSGQLAPHQPLQRAYFSTLRSHKSLEKHSVSRLSYLFAHLDLLSSETFSFLIFLLLFSSPTLPISAFHLSILSGVCLLNFLR